MNILDMLRGLASGLGETAPEGESNPVMDALRRVPPGGPPTGAVKSLAERRLLVAANAEAAARDRKWRLAARRGMSPARAMEAFGATGNGGSGNRAFAFAMMGRPDLANLAHQQWAAQEEAASRDRMTQAQFGAGSPAMLEALSRAEDSRTNRANQAWDIYNKNWERQVEGSPEGMALTSALKNPQGIGVLPQILKQIKLFQQRGIMPNMTPPAFPGMPGAGTPSSFTPSAPQKLTPADELSLLPQEIQGEAFLDRLLSRTSSADAPSLVDLMKQRAVTPDMLKLRLDKYDPSRKGWLSKSWNSIYYPELRSQRLDPFTPLSKLFFNEEDPVLTQARQKNLATTNALVQALGL